LHHETQSVDRECGAVALAEILYFDHGVRLSGMMVRNAGSRAPGSAIGIRASGVVMMVDIKELSISPRRPGIGRRTAGG
jgi:hypothetical protein